MGLLDKMRMPMPPPRPIGLGAPPPPSRPPGLGEAPSMAPDLGGMTDSDFAAPGGMPAGMGAGLSKIAGAMKGTPAPEAGPINYPQAQPSSIGPDAEHDQQRIMSQSKPILEGLLADPNFVSPRTRRL